MIARLDPHVVQHAVAAALAEDLGERGDVTTDAIVPQDLRATAHLVAREATVVAGLPVARAVFAALDAQMVFRAHVQEGEAAAAGDRLATVTGRMYSRTKHVPFPPACTKDDDSVRLWEESAKLVGIA